MRVKQEISVNLINMDRIPLDKKTFSFANCLNRRLFIPPYSCGFPAIRVAKRKNGRYDIKDGRHRWVAHKLLGREKILAKFSTQPLEEVVLLPRLKLPGFIIRACQKDVNIIKLCTWYHHLLKRQENRIKLLGRQISCLTRRNHE